MKHAGLRLSVIAGLIAATALLGGCHGRTNEGDDFIYNPYGYGNPATGGVYDSGVTPVEGTTTNPGSPPPPTDTISKPQARGSGEQPDPVVLGTAKNVQSVKAPPTAQAGIAPTRPDQYRQPPGSTAPPPGFRSPQEGGGIAHPPDSTRLPGARPGHATNDGPFDPQLPGPFDNRMSGPFHTPTWGTQTP